MIRTEYNGENYEDELEAQAFAFELLMPEKDVRKWVNGQIKKSKAGLRTLNIKEVVIGLSERYQVSKEAAEKRLIQLGYN